MTAKSQKFPGPWKRSYKNVKIEHKDGQLYFNWGPSGHHEAYKDLMTMGNLNTQWTKDRTLKQARAIIDHNPNWIKQAKANKGKSTPKKSQAKKKPAKKPTAKKGRVKVRGYYVKPHTRAPRSKKK